MSTTTHTPRPGYHPEGTPDLLATIKAALVVLFFMHVKYASRLTKIFVCAAFLWLAILFALTFADYVTRGWLPHSSGWGHQTNGPPQPPPPAPFRADAIGFTSFAPSAH